jgi:hypothetical protein
LLLTGALALGGLAGCGDDVSVVQPPPPVDGVTGITISPTNVTLEVGETGVFTASVQTTGSAAKTATFSSSNTSVATIDATSGTVTAVAPGNTTITATATADANQKSSTQLTVVPVDVDVAATVSIQSITTGNLGTPVNIANTYGQIDVSINLEANDEQVSTLDLLVDGEVVASQVYSAVSLGAFSYTKGSAEAAADVIVLSFRTDAFDPATGVADFLNGQHEINAVANVASSGTGTQRASNTITLNFNNNDAFYVEIDNTPTNTPAVKSAINPATSVEWRQGDVSITSIPVVYTPTAPNGDTPKSVCTRTVNWAGAAAVVVGAPGACLGGVETTVIDLTPGYQTPSLAPAAQITDLPQVPAATFADGSAMFFNQNAVAINSVNGVTNVSLARFPAPPAGSSNIGLAAGVAINGFNMDNLAPAGVSLTLPPVADDRWVNAAFDWADPAVTSRGADGGVGLALPSADVYEYSKIDDGYATYASFAATTNDIPEHPSDFTRDAYAGQLTVLDLLNNGSTVVVNATPAEGDHFGVDITPPTIEYTSELTGAALGVNVMGLTVDSILNDALVNDQGLTSATALFGVRARDTRSGFNTVVGQEPMFRRIQYENPNGFLCAEGVLPGCDFFALLPPVGVDDPTYRRDSIPVFGVGNADVVAATTPGYVLYETYIVDRAGNQSATVKKQAVVDVTAPQITGLQIPAILTGGAQLSWVPTGLDDVEVTSGQLYLNYPNVGQLAFGENATGYDGVFDCTWSLLTCEFGTPVGPGASFGANGIASPIGFLRSVSQVTPADSAPPLAINPTDKPDFVGAQLYDIKRSEGTLGGASPDSSGVLNVALLPGLIQNGQLFSTIGVGKWFVFANGTTGGTIQARAKTLTTVTNPPFPQVSFYRFDVANGTWDFLGVVTASAPSNPTIFDQGADRFWTYSLTGVAPALATGENIMAIGMSAAGDGLATLTFLVP